MIQEFSALPTSAITAAGVAVYRNTDGEAVLSTLPITQWPEGITDTNAAVAGDPVRTVIYGYALGIAGEAIAAADFNKFLVVGASGHLFLLEAADYTTAGTTIVNVIGRARGVASGAGIALSVFVNPSPVSFFTVTP